MEIYLKRVWFSNGIHHHYGSEKFVPNFSQDFLKQAVLALDAKQLPLAEGQTAEQLCDELFPVIFDPAIMPKRVNQADGEDLVLTSACNYYLSLIHICKQFVGLLRVHEPILFLKIILMGSRIHETECRIDGGMIHSLILAVIDFTQIHGRYGEPATNGDKKCGGEQ